jgi:hypothetical protein
MTLGKGDGAFEMSLPFLFTEQEKYRAKENK